MTLCLWRWGAPWQRNMLFFFQIKYNEDYSNKLIETSLIGKTYHRMKSHLSIDWMAKWWLNGDWMVTRKVDFSRISATIQWLFSRLNVKHISVTFQLAFFFLKNKLLNAARTRVDESQRITLTIQPQGPLDTMMDI